MSKARQYVEDTIGFCQSVTKGLTELPRGSQDDTSALKMRLDLIVTRLEGLLDKFFLKTNPSVRFASACLKDAEQMEVAFNRLKETSEREVTSNFHNLFSELEALEKDVKVLEGKVAMRGIVIT